jgi:hypothetical protein
VCDEERFRAKIAQRVGSDTRAVPIGRARAGIHLLAKLAVRERCRKVPDVVMVKLTGAELVFSAGQHGLQARRPGGADR